MGLLLLPPLLLLLLVLLLLLLLGADASLDPNRPFPVRSLAGSKMAISATAQAVTLDPLLRSSSYVMAVD
jgi:hypothetical protein